LTHGVDGRRYSLAFRRRLRRRYTNNNIQRIHGSECGIEIWSPSVENDALELRPRATFSTSGSSYFNANLITMHYLYIVVQTYIRIHTVSKNDTDVACCNFDEHQPILIIFDRGVAERALTNGAVFSHPTLLMSLHYLAKHGNAKIATCMHNVAACIIGLPEFTQSLLAFLILHVTNIYSTLLIHKSCNLIIWVQFWATGAITYEKILILYENFSLQQLNCVECIKRWCRLPCCWKTKLTSTVFDNS